MTQPPAPAPAAPTELLVVEFEGWYQYRHPTDPDPTDEPRGSSGYTFAFGDEPDLDSIMRFQPDPSIPIRTHAPPVGVSVTRATRLYPGGEQELPGLDGATVDLLDGPMLVNRNWVLTLPGYEPIVPFNLEVKTPLVRIYREAPVTPEPMPIQKVPEKELTAYGATGLAYEPDTVAPAIGVWLPFQQYVDRLAALQADRERAVDRGADLDGPEIAVLDGRIAELQAGIALKDRRISVRHVIERFGFGMLGKIDVSGDQPGVLGGRLSTDPTVGWRIDFWMGGWDPDVLCAFVRGSLQIPYATPTGAGAGGPEQGRSMFTVNRRIRSEIHRRRIEQWPSEGHRSYSDLDVTKAELASFQAELRGTVVTPASPGYDTGRMGNGNSHYESFPQLIVYCKVMNDVAVCLAWAHRKGWWITCRSGGHSTAGFSVNSGVVIDVGELDHVVVDPDAKLAHVGPGAQFYDLNTTLASYGLHVPGGGCGSVCAGGFMQGGGYGFTSRKYGMNCDNVHAILMMLADGSIVRADAETNPDLFWAVRGGTGNQFGVLLDITYRLHELDEVWGFALKWSLDEAPAAMARMQQDYTLSLETVDIGYMGGITQLDGKTIFAMFGVYPGEWTAGMQMLAPLLDTGSPALAVSQSGTYAELDENIIENFLPGIPQGTTYEAKDCAYVTEMLSADDWAEILDYHDQKTPNPYNIMFVEPYGGVLNEAREDNRNAFIHRDTYMDLYVDSFWQRGGSFTQQGPANEFLEGYIELIEKHSDGQKYQNYPRRDAPDYRWAYWRDAYNSLLFVKHKYDPDGVFRFEEAITPYPDGPGIHRSDAPSLFADPNIAYEPWSRRGRLEPHD